MIFSNLKRHVVATLIFFVLSSTTGLLWAQSTSSYNKNVQAKINQVENGLRSWVKTDKTPACTLSDRMQHYNVKGLSIAVIKDYKVDWIKAYGLADSAENRKLTTNTRFQAASISKSLNAVGVLKLVQEGKIDLNEDINSYLKSWKFPYDSTANGKKITVANLLSHTAGLTVHGFGGYAIGDSIPTVYQILDGKKPSNTASVRSEKAPGLVANYSGGGTVISRVIIEDITGKPYDKFMKEEVLDPLGMKISSYTQPPLLLKDSPLATGYVGGQEVKGKYHIYPEESPDGLWTTPADLAKYVIEMQLAVAGKSKKVLDQQTALTMLKPVVDSSFALGNFKMNKNGTRYFSHDGQNEGFVSNYTASFTGGNGVVIMTNSDDARLYSEVINAVADVYSWPGYMPVIVKKEIFPTTLELDAFVGKYQQGTYPVAFEKIDNSLWIKQDGRTWKVHFSAPDQFFIYEWQADLEFTRDKAGQVTGFSIDHDDKQKVTKI